MKPICIVGYNFGKKYQSFIPIYIYSILKSYPSYSVLVFSDTFLDENVKYMLQLIEGLGEFEVIENYNFGIESTSKIKKAKNLMSSIRWLFYDERFSNYETLYIGDIDIFICKEEYDIYFQHMEHSRILGLPYSNYIRLTADDTKLTAKMFIYYLLNKQNDILKAKLEKKIRLENRLTGLHFVKTKEYFEKTRPLFNKYINELIEQPEMRSRNDESLLYDLIEESNIGLPPVSPNSPEMDSRFSSSIAFRPHHGIHLGIFRNKDNLIKQRQLLDSYVYVDYYRKYKKLLETDRILVDLINLSDDFVASLFKKMEDYYSSREE